MAGSGRISLDSLQGWWENPFSNDGAANMYYVKGSKVFIKNAPTQDALKIVSGRKLSLGKYNGTLKSNGTEIAWDGGKIMWSHIGELPDMYDPETRQGRFKYVSLLGKGANGVVCEALDMSSAAGKTTPAHKKVAIKVLRLSDGFFANSKELWKSALRLHDEYVWSRMFLHNSKHERYNAKHSRYFLEYFEDHTGFPKASAADLLDSNRSRKLERTEVARLPYIVMELARGVMAWKALFEPEEKGLASFKKKDRREIVWQLASALDYLGKFELLHRDLHFHNIFLLRTRGRLAVTIGDLGMMSHHSNVVCFAPYDEDGWKMRDWVPWEAWNLSSKASRVRNAPAHSSQQAGKGSWQAFDIFSLGVIHLYLCLGQAETRRILERLRSGHGHASAEGESLKKLIVEPSLALQMVSKDPSERPAPAKVLDAPGVKKIGVVQSFLAWFSRWFLAPKPSEDSASSSAQKRKANSQPDSGGLGSKRQRTK